MLLCNAEYASAQQDTLKYIVAPSQKLQQCEGWGSSICWWGNKCGEWSELTIDRMIDWLVSPTGLNMNIFRYNIGGGDDPANAHCTPHHMGSGKGLRAEMEGFQDGPGEPYKWERDAAQRRIMLKIKEKRPDAIFEAFSNSAPWWMTYSGCCGGAVNANDDNLRPEYYEAFAHYLVDVCKHYKDEYGIEFRTLEPFNEPNTNYWPANGSQEGCHFSAKAQADFLKILSPILRQSGLKTIISASDETNVQTAVTTFNTLKQCNVTGLIGQWNTHTYGHTNRARSQFGTLGRSTGCPVWQSESGNGGNGLEGNLNMAQRMFDDINYILPSAWIDWQYHEEYGDQWCLVNGPYTQQNSLQRTKNYYVRQVITKYFKQGYYFVPSTCERTLAAVNASQDTMVLAVVNNTTAKQVHRIHLPFTAIGSIKAYQTTETANGTRVAGICKTMPDSTLLVTAPVRSIVTMIVPISVNEERNTLLPGETYMILPQSNIGMAMCVSGSQIIIAPVNPSDPAQQWTIEESGKNDGKLKLRNGKGRYASYNHRTGSYYLIANAKSSTYTQAFSIEQVEDFFFRIAHNSVAFDLEGNALSSGTKVGMWEYGNSPAADTRNWRFVKLGRSPEATDAITSVLPASQARKGIYSLSGTQLGKPEPGINIVCNGDNILKIAQK